MEHGLLQEKLIEVSAEEVVLNFLISRKQSKHNSESGLAGTKIYPKKWKLTDKEWQYLEGDEEAKCCKLTFTWKRFLARFGLPDNYWHDLLVAGTKTTMFNGVWKAKIILSASLCKGELSYDLEFDPNFKWMEKHHKNISLDKALELIDLHARWF